jgi:tetratricopeptide (TPR) repeat protein
MPFLFRATAALLLGGVCILGAQADAEAILRQAATMHQAGNIAGAIEGYRRYLAIHPDNFQVLSNLGAAYAKLARYDEAIEQYRHALKVQPGNAPIELNLALAYYKTGHIDQAAAGFEKVYKAAPDQLQPALLLADCRLAMGDNKRVDALLTPWAKQKPDDLAVAYLLGTALVRDNQVARGQVFIEKILHNGGSAEAHLLLGTTTLNARDYPAALAELKKAVEIDPHLGAAWAYYGLALLGTGDPAAAAEAFRKELANNPYDFSSNLQLAVLLNQDEKFEEARGYLRRALQVRPGDIGARFQQTSLELRAGNVEAARKGLESIVKEAPDFKEAHVSLATVYYRLKRKEDGDRERAVFQKLNRETQAQQQNGLNIK